MNLEDYKMKKCKICGIEKLLCEFNKRSDAKDGLFHNCRECTKQKGKKYYIENKNKIKKYQKEFYQKNNELILNRTKNYREINSDKIKEYEIKRRAYRKEYLNNYHNQRRKMTFCLNYLQI